MVRRGLVDQLVELGPDAVHLLTDLVPVHVAPPLCGYPGCSRASPDGDVPRSPCPVCARPLCRAGERLLVGPDGELHGTRAARRLPVFSAGGQGPDRAGGTAT